MEKLLFIAPHLSTGGLPQVLVNKIELLKNDYIIKCVEWDWTGDAFVIQKNRVKEHIGPENLITLGEDKTKLFDIISDFNPDLICLEEFCEHFIPEEINKKLFSKDRSYKLFETTHDSSIPVTNKRWFPDKFIFVSPFNAFRYSMFDVPYDIIEYPIDVVTPNKEWAQEQLMLDPNFKHVVIVGLFTERKNQAYAFEMARRVIGQNILFHFIGNQADNFAHYWLPLMGNKPDNCIVWGERNDVDTFLQASDLFLFPSKGDRNNKELNPIAIKEAIKYELPMMMFNLDVYCGKYNNNQKIKFMSGDITQDTNTLLDMLGKNDILSLFNLSYESNENKINILNNWKCLSGVEVSTRGPWRRAGIKASESSPSPMVLSMKATSTRVSSTETAPWSTLMVAAMLPSGTEASFLMENTSSMMTLNLVLRQAMRPASSNGTIVPLRTGASTLKR